MNTAWHHIHTFYGCNVSIPEEYNYQEFINILDGLNNILEEPFRFIEIFGSFYMDISLKEPTILDSISNIIIGFDVTDIDLHNMHEVADALKEYIDDNPILEGIIISKNAQFYSGVDCFHATNDFEYEEDDYEYSL